MSPRYRREMVDRSVAATLGRSVDDPAAAAAILNTEALGLAGPGRASTAQALADHAPGMLTLEGGLAKDSGALQARLSGLRKQSADELASAGEVAFSGRPELLQGAFTRLRDTSKSTYQALYSKIDDASVGPVPFAPVKAEAQAILDEAGRYGGGQAATHAMGAGSSALDLARKVLKDTDTIEFSDMRKLRTALTDKTRSLRASLKMGGSAEELRQASRLLGKVDETIDGLGASGVPAAGQLRAANTAYREHQDLYSRAHPTVRKLLDNEDPGDAIRALTGRGTARPADEARRLLASVSGDADATEGLRRLFVDEAFGGTVGEGAGKKALSFLDKHKRPAEILLGDEGYRTARQIADRLRITTYGRAGTAGFSQSTGSAYANASEQLDAGVGVVEMLLSPGAGVARAGTKAAVEWMRDRVTREMQSQLLADALVDPKIARDLLLKVTPGNIASWQSRMRGHIERSAVRAGVTMPSIEKGGQ